MRHEVYEYAKRFKRIHFDIIPTDPKFVAYGDLPENLIILMGDIFRDGYLAKKKDVDNLEKQAKGTILTKFAKIHEERKRNCEYILLHWTRTSNLDTAILDTCVLDIMVMYQMPMSFDRKVLRTSLRRYHMTLRFGQKL